LGENVMNNIFVLKFAFLSLFMITPLFALKVYVVNNLINTVSIFDTTTNVVSGNVTDLASPTFNIPEQIVATPDGSTAFVTNRGGNSVSVIDVATDKVTQEILDSSFNQPIAIAITPDGSKIYVANFNGGSPGGTISVIDVLSKTVIDVITDASFAGPNSIAFTPDGKTALVSNTNTNEVTIINVATNSATGTVGGLSFSNPDFVAVKPDGTEAYVSNRGGGNGVSVVDLSTNQAIEFVQNPNFNQPDAIAFSHDGTIAYVINQSRFGGFISIVDAQTDTVTPMGRVAGNTGGTAIAFTPDPTAYVAQGVLNQVGIIDVATNTQTGTVSDPDNLLDSPISLVIINPVIITTTITGCRKENIFLTQIEYINLIRWQAPEGLTVVEYQIFRDAALTDLAGTVSASDQLVFQDHNRDPNVVYTYYLVGVTDTGSSTTLANITVTKKCG